VKIYFHANELAENFCRVLRKPPVNFIFPL